MTSCHDVSEPLIGLALAQGPGIDRLWWQRWSIFWPQQNEVPLTKLLLLHKQPAAETGCNCLI